LDFVIETDNVSIIIIYGALFTEKENFKLINWCHARSIKVVYDQVDWLDLNWHNPLRGIIRYRNQHLMDRKVIPACDGVICISNYLSEYHRNKGMTTVVIPPLSLEVSKPEQLNRDQNDTIQLVYAGTTSDINRPTSQWKDRIDLMLKKLADVSDDKSLKPFQIDIFGMTMDQYIGMFPNKEKEAGRQVLKQLGERVCFHGLVPNSEATEGIRKADFTVLIRDKKRSTMAGFPTKVSESISCGTPVLCNDTSDIKTYVVPELTGLVMDDVAEMFRKALSMNEKQIVRMKNACSDNPFYYEKYCRRMSMFMGLIQKNG
jgi:glycosyltransferase involved in cell wall biosynthesis